MCVAGLQNAERDHCIDIQTVMPCVKNPERKRKRRHLQLPCHWEPESGSPSSITGIRELLKRFRIEEFRVSMVLSSQTLLVSFLRSSSVASSILIPHVIETALWTISLTTLLCLCLLYLARAILHPRDAKKDFRDRVGKNYFFAPLISSVMLTIAWQENGVHGSQEYLRRFWQGSALAAMAALGTSVYSDWFMRGQGSNMLCAVANPSTYLSVAGNFIAATAAARNGWTPIAEAFMSVGAVHYLILLVTLYQRLPSNAGLPSPEMNPLFFMFLSGPAAAALACKYITGGFGVGSRMCYFLALFFFVSLVCRAKLFSGSRRRWYWWWSSGFPVTVLALDAVAYADEMQTAPARWTAAGFCMLSVAAFAGLVFAAFVQFSVLAIRSRFRISVCLFRFSASSVPAEDNLGRKKRRILLI